MNAQLFKTDSFAPRTMDSLSTPSSPSPRMNNAVEYEVSTSPMDYASATASYARQYEASVRPLVYAETRARALMWVRNKWDTLKEEEKANVDEETRAWVMLVNARRGALREWAKASAFWGVWFDVPEEQREAETAVARAWARVEEMLPGEAGWTKDDYKRYNPLNVALLKALAVAKLGREKMRADVVVRRLPEVEKEQRKADNRRKKREEVAFAQRRRDLQKKRYEQAKKSKKQKKEGKEPAQKK